MPAGLFCDESEEQILENCASLRCGSDVWKTSKTRENVVTGPHIDINDNAKLLLKQIRNNSFML